MCDILLIATFRSFNIRHVTALTSYYHCDVIQMVCDITMEWGNTNAEPDRSKGIPIMWTMGPHRATIYGTLKL